MKRYNVKMPRRPLRFIAIVDRNSPEEIVYEEFSNIIEVGFWLVPDTQQKRTLADMDPYSLASFDKMTLADVDINGYLGLSIL